MHNIYLILIMYLLFCSCQKKTTDNSVLTPMQDTATANAAICTEQADTNIVLKHDTVYPIRTWGFNYKDGIFPCEYRDGGVVIRGFDTDWNGRFYIAGDYPVRVVCYNGTTLEFNRVISTSKGNSATFKLIGDSIWFLEEESHSVLSMHKSGSGIINHYTLPAIQEEDIIHYGEFREKNFIIYTEHPIVHQSCNDNNANFFFHLYKYPAKDIKKISHPDSTLYYEDIINHFPREASNSFGCDFYKKINDRQIIRFTHQNRFASVMFLENDSNLIYDVILGNIPPSHTCCDYDTYSLNGERHFVGNACNDMYRLNDYKFIFTGYNMETKTFHIMEYDLDPKKICPQKTYRKIKENLYVYKNV